MSLARIFPNTRGILSIFPLVGGIIGSTIGLKKRLAIQIHYLWEKINKPLRYFSPDTENPHLGGARINHRFHRRVHITHSNFYSNAKRGRNKSAQPSSKQKFLPSAVLPLLSFPRFGRRFNKGRITRGSRESRECERGCITGSVKLIRLFGALVTAGYYTIEQTSEKYRIIFLNTNLWLNTADNRMLHHQSGASVVDNTQDPLNQWSWFQTTLETARRKEETVRIQYLPSFLISSYLAQRYIKLWPVNISSFRKPCKLSHTLPTNNNDFSTKTLLIVNRNEGSDLMGRVEKFGMWREINRGREGEEEKLGGKGGLLTKRQFPPWGMKIAGYQCRCRFVSSILVPVAINYLHGTQLSG